MEENGTPVNSEETSRVSAFADLTKMNQTDAINVLIQASIQAQKAGVLSIRDSILVGAAIELITNKPL